jgi:two-component system chemotaxis sensor kinase CheA
MDAILEQFLIEAREDLEYLDQHLEDLDGGDSESVNALFRAAHTLKGGAGLVGFDAVKEITHAAEDLLDAFRKGEVDFSQELLDTLYDAFDEVVELIDAAEELGTIEVEVNKERVDELRESIRALLTKDKSSSEDEESLSVESVLNIEDKLYVAELFSHIQIADFIKNNQIPVEDVKVSREYLDNQNLWLIDFDLDVDTIKLGNDPIYLLYLLGEENTLLVGVVANCENIKQEPLEWVTHMAVIVRASESELEDSFYNILDEITLKPLSLNALFGAGYDSVKSDTFEEFKDEFLELLSSGTYQLLDEKLSAITQILNPETLEGFVLTRLQALLPNFEIGSKDYLEVIETALRRVGIEMPKTKQQSTQSEAEDRDLGGLNGTTLSPKERETVENILNSQLKVLALAKDSSVLERTKLLLKNILTFANYDTTLDTIDTIEGLREFIESVKSSLSHEVSESNKKELQTEAIEQRQSTQGIKKEQPKPAKETQQKTDTVNTVKKEQHHQTISKTVKIEQHQIDELMDIVGELLVMKNALPYIANHIKSDSVEHAKRELLGKYDEISRLTDQLQDRVMDMRLLPLSYIFSRYPKLIRDISKKLGKRIKYVEEGGETKLDKAVIEKLADPLVHIIRN